MLMCSVLDVWWEPLGRLKHPTHTHTRTPCHTDTHLAPRPSFCPPGWLSPIESRLKKGSGGDAEELRQGSPHPMPYAEATNQLTPRVPAGPTWELQWHLRLKGREEANGGVSKHNILGLSSAFRWSSRGPETLLDYPAELPHSPATAIPHSQH